MPLTTEEGNQNVPYIDQYPRCSFRGYDEKRAYNRFKALYCTLAEWLSFPERCTWFGLIPHLKKVSPIGDHPMYMVVEQHQSWITFLMLRQMYSKTELRQDGILEILRYHFKDVEGFDPETNIWPGHDTRASIIERIDFVGTISSLDLLNKVYDYQITIAEFDEHKNCVLEVYDRIRHIVNRMPNLERVAYIEGLRQVADWQ